MPKRDFKGVWIPRDIWEDEKLSWMEKLLYVEIDSLQDKERGGCYASNAYFAQFFGRSKSRISEIVSSLKKKGKVRVYLVHHPLQGRIETARLIRTEKLTIRKTDQTPGKTRKGYSDFQKGYSENGDYSITSNNTKRAGRPTPRAGAGPAQVGKKPCELKDPVLRKLFEEASRKKEGGKSEEKTQS